MPEGLEVVVEQTDNLTTFQLPVSFSAVHRAFSADLSVEPETEHDTTLDSFCVVDDRDLVQEVRVPDRGSITFLDWGVAPDVEAPPASEVEDELEYILRNGMATDAGH